ncbi:MAG TPA: hypothetical protein ENH82_12925 [bacterium]|nr:hypothetical protein [bacterium]
MEAYIKLTEGDLDVLEDASTEEWLRIMCKNLVAEVRDLREEVKPRTKAIEVLCDAIDGINDHNNKLRDVIQAFKIRIAYIGHPYEPADWSEVITFADEVLKECS